MAVKQQIYQWHRRLSLIIALPVLLWAISGLMHPFMTAVKPKIKHGPTPPNVIDTGEVKVPLAVVLQQLHLDSVQQVNIVRMHQQPFYQVEPGSHYVSATTGQEMPDGAAEYARSLAQTFLGDRNCNISRVTRITAFTDQYRDINRLLPVYKVDFDRSDGISLYVDDAGSRLALATDHFRIGFQRFFTLVHTWEWLLILGKGRLVVEAILAGLTFITALLGLYLFFCTKPPKARSNQRLKYRALHRITSIITVLFTLMFSFSGAFHALAKFKGDHRRDFFVAPYFAAGDVQLNLPRLLHVLDPNTAINSLSLVSLQGENYWRINQTWFNNTADLEACCRKPGEVVPVNAQPKVTYVRMSDYQVLPDGDARYARYLAHTFSGLPDRDIQATDPVTAFGGEYEFIDKRLPVVKVSYGGAAPVRYYVETSTGVLSVAVSDKDLVEGYSFALLHKHHFWDGLGKTVRDASTITGALLNVLAVVIGLILYRYTIKKKNKSLRHY
ncbi:PepSY-associated TM region [Chitinophaga costaii]|uniref:PepSY-associated TM region n=1 Tax=Chitinophaga costaii TaxID=1335309 RepID=A0A1C4G0F2_9BACT|nr:PepSY-associated TM helix domain-containing protein [Chitinophaga costaii]SCC61315.1 PepSY-associated TM region [Chitinophaga costaii]